jgi:NOL1/NOP2/fmu family ribosome biogenesis protein
MSGDIDDGANGDETAGNDGSRFDRLPETADDREVEDRATRREVLEWWDERFGISPSVFEDHTFWEKGAGKVWILADDLPSPVGIEGLGMTFLRTRQEHWKPTTNAVQRFGRLAERNVVGLSREEAERCVRGEDLEPEWDGDWGYLIATHELAGRPEPLGVGLYLYGELRSTVPKGRRLD